MKALAKAESKTIGFKTEPPKVSVIVPVYNSERYIRESLDSILRQPRLDAMEVICVDDGSSDSSREIVESYLKVDSRVRLIRQDHQGPGIARNAGMDAAKGVYIALLDADDRFSSGDALSRACEQAKRDNLDVLLATATTIDEEGRILRTDSGLYGKFIPSESVFAPDALGEKLFLCANTAPWAKLYRRAFLEENRLRFPALMRSEDFPMFELTMALAARIGAFRESIYDHRIGVASSLESTKDETPLIFFEAEQLLRNDLRERNLWSRYKAAVYTAFAVRLAYNLRAVMRYSSFKAIIAKYRQEREQWICWEDVGLLEWDLDTRRLIEDIVSDLDEGEQISLFVKLRDMASRRTMMDIENAKMAKYSESIASLQKQLDATRAVRDAALKERDRLRENLDATRQVRDAVLQERNVLRKNLDATRQVRDAVLKERDSLRANFGATRSVCAAALKERDLLRSSVQSAEKALDGALAERDEVRRELNALKDIFVEIEKICGTEKGDA